MVKVEKVKVFKIICFRKSSYLQGNLYGKVEGGGGQEDKGEEELVNPPVRILSKYLFHYLSL